jgi:periplasmic protein TonB
MINIRTRMMSLALAATIWTLAIWGVTMLRPTLMNLTAEEGGGIELFRIPEPPPPPPVIIPKPEVPRPPIVRVPVNAPTPTSPPEILTADQADGDPIPVGPPIEGAAPGPITAGPAVETGPVTPPAPPIVVQPRRLSGTEPDFPERALRLNRDGYAILEFTVLPNGLISNPRIVEESPRNFGFGRASMAVVDDWRFSPRTVDGEARPYTARYRVTFRLQD